jgi:hypothetical protein
LIPNGHPKNPYKNAMAMDTGIAIAVSISMAITDLMINCRVDQTGIVAAGCFLSIFISYGRP